MEQQIKKKRGQTMIFLAVILIIIGLTMLFSPTLFWKLTESWKSENASSPSDLYKVNVTFGGIMMILVGLAGVLAELFLT